jgi:hypothetical protein
VSLNLTFLHFIAVFSDERFLQGMAVLTVDTNLDRDFLALGFGS